LSVSEWEERVLEQPGASERVAEIEQELRTAAGLPDKRANVDPLDKEPPIPQG
jgi:hypothetical protein